MMIFDTNLNMAGSKDKGSKPNQAIARGFLLDMQILLQTQVHKYGLKSILASVLVLDFN